MSFTELTEAEIRTYYSHYYPQLDRHKTGDHWSVPCLLHDGKDNNLKIQIATGLFHCFSRCGLGGNTLTFEQKLHDIDSKAALVNVFQIIGRAVDEQSKRPVAYYDYVDEHSGLLYQKVRYEPKSFSLRRPDQNRTRPHLPPDPKNKSDWINNLKGTHHVLYRLPSVLAASIVFVVEGEKDVHTIEGLGFTGTCNPLGAGKWLTTKERTEGRVSQFTEKLRGKEYVYVIRDNDSEGLAHAHDVAQDVKHAGIPVKLLTLTMGKDVSDWVRAGFGKDDLLRIVDETPNYDSAAPPETPAEDDTKATVPRDRRASLPWIIVPDRPLSAVSAQAQLALCQFNQPVPHLFLRGARVVEVVADELGRQFLRRIDDSSMRGYLARAAYFVKPKKH